MSSTIFDAAAQQYSEAGIHGLICYSPKWPPYFLLRIHPDCIKIERMATKVQEGGQLAVQHSRLGPPKMYKVLLLNDDYTPMDFVITVLQRFFSLDTEQATQIMLKVHNEGRGVCGVFPRDIAATKVEQVIAFARQHQHPLACIMEEN